MSREEHLSTKAILAVYLCAGLVSALANETWTPEFNQLISGYPLHAVRDAYHSQIGDIFYVIVFVGVFLGMYIRIQNLTYCVMLLDIGLAIFWQYTVYPIGYLALGANILALGNLLVRTLSPIHTEG